MLGTGIALDPTATEVFILHGLELLEPATLDRAKMFKIHDTPQYLSQEYAATSI